MTYTSEQRRKKIYQLMEKDYECMRLEQEFWAEKQKYERFVNRIPRFLRDRLYGYPTMSYHYHQWIITLLCEKLRFEEEK